MNVFWWWLNIMLDEGNSTLLQTKLVTLGTSVSLAAATWGAVRLVTGRWKL